MLIHSVRACALSFVLCGTLFAGSHSTTFIEDTARGRVYADTEPKLTEPVPGTRDASEYDLKKLFEKPTVAVVWSMRCPPCMRELVEIKDLVAKRTDVQWVFYNIDGDELPENRDAFIARHGLTGYPIVVGKGVPAWGDAARGMPEIETIPKTLLITGNEVKEVIGVTDPASLEAKINTSLPKPLAGGADPKPLPPPTAPLPLPLPPGLDPAPLHDTPPIGGPVTPPPMSPPPIPPLAPPAMDANPPEIIIGQAYDSGFIQAGREYRIGSKIWRARGDGGYDFVRDAVGFSSDLGGGPSVSAGGAPSFGGGCPPGGCGQMPSFSGGCPPGGCGQMPSFSGGCPPGGCRFGAPPQFAQFPAFQGMPPQFIGGCGPMGCGGFRGVPQPILFRTPSPCGPGGCRFR